MKDQANVVYENKHYKVIFYPDFNEENYLVVNKDNNRIEAEEKALPTALYKADGLEAALLKFYSGKES